MFKEKANMAFNKCVASYVIIGSMESMHPQMRRLYQAAEELRDTTGQTKVAKLINAIPQTLKNWESRGISSEGLLAAQQFIGCDAIWLRDGSGSMTGRQKQSALHMNDVLRLLTLFDQATDDGKRQILRMAETVEKRSPS